MPPSIVVKNDTFVLITSIPPMHRIAAVGNLGTSRIFSKLKLFKWVNNKKLQEKYLNYSNTQQIRRIISFSDENFHKPSPYVRSTYIFPIKKTAVQIGPQFDMIIQTLTTYSRVGNPCYYPSYLKSAFSIQHFQISHCCQ